MIRWLHRAASLAWAYVSGTLEDRSEWRKVWGRGVFCEKPGCGKVGQYWVEVNARHWHCCRKHADELMDLMLGGFSKAVNDLNRREQAGEFLQADTSRGFEVYKSRGRMGPHSLEAIGQPRLK